MQTADPNKLIRGVGTLGATSLNMIDMIGVGPFITMPLIIAAMGGPQAMLGWIFGAVLVICDGLVWAELGASMPKSGGAYYYLKEIYGERHQPGAAHELVAAEGGDEAPDAGLRRPPLHQKAV